VTPFPHDAWRRGAVRRPGRVGARPWGGTTRRGLLAAFVLVALCRGAGAQPLTHREANLAVAQSYPAFAGVHADGQNLTVRATGEIDAGRAVALLDSLAGGTLRFRRVVTGPARYGYARLDAWRAEADSVARASTDRFNYAVVSATENAVVITFLEGISESEIAGLLKRTSIPADALRVRWGGVLYDD
jgi:hypothetical protein